MIYPRRLNKVFKRGDRVQLSDEAHKSNIRRSRSTVKGMVISDQRSSKIVRVTWDGTCGPDQIHEDFIEVIIEEHK